MTVYNEWTLNLSYLPQNLTEEACYRYNILIRYKRLRENGFSEKEALEFLQVKHSHCSLPKIRPLFSPVTIIKVVAGEGSGLPKTTIVYKQIAVNIIKFILQAICK